MVVWALAATAAAQTPVGIITAALGGNTDSSSGLGALHLGGPEVVLQVLKHQITTLPLGTSSGGYTWEFDPALGIVVRKSQSFGAIFSERPLTIGRHKLSIGVTTQHTAWRSLAGQDLRGGGVYWSDRFGDDFYTAAKEPVLEKGVSTVELKTDRTSINATFGLTDRADLHVIVPFGRTRVLGAVDYSYTVLSSGTEFRRLRASGSSDDASGLADVSVRGKYLLISRRAMALAAAGEARFPTGDQDNLLGTGKFQKRVSALGSMTVNRYSPHFELGYLFAGTGLQFTSSSSSRTLASASPSDEITYTVGVDAAMSTRITIAADVLGRTLRDSARIVRTDTVFPASPLVNGRSANIGPKLRVRRATMPSCGSNVYVNPPEEDPLGMWSPDAGGLRRARGTRSRAARPL